MSLLIVADGSLVHNKLHTKFHSPIELEDGIRYGIGLVSLEFNGVDSYQISVPKNKILHVIKFAKEVKYKIPSGIYTIKELENILNELINDINKISLKFDTLTRKYSIEIPNTISIIFSENNSLYDIFGISQSSKQYSGITLTSDQQIANSLLNVGIECNIATGSYYNNTPAHIIFDTCINNMDYTYKYITPQNIIYLPINTKQITDIYISLSSKGIKLKNDYIKVTLHIREWDSVSTRMTGDAIKPIHSH